ncbi:MAG: hypothetical protein Tsb009_18750 [Planctomycetaceae bacterium]
MTKDREKHGASMDPQYPFGLIAAAVRSTVGTTLAAYVLYIAGTIIGLQLGAGSEQWLNLWIVFVLPYILLTGLESPSAPLTLLAVIAIWYLAAQSDSLKRRLISLAIIFLLALGNAWSISGGW